MKPARRSATITANSLVEAIPVNRCRHVAALLAAAAIVCASTGGIEVWMPQTGEVALEETPRATQEARRLHAYALVGAGQWSGTPIPIGTRR